MYSSLNLPINALQQIFHSIYSATLTNFIPYYIKIMVKKTGFKLHRTSIE